MVKSVSQLSSMDTSQEPNDEISSQLTLFPFDVKVNKLIMQYLNGADFLKLSEISRSFSTYVNNYQMDKIQLVIHETLEKMLDVPSLLCSKREYKHIKITRLVYAHPAMRYVFDRHSNWLVSVETAYDFVFDRCLLSVTSLKMNLGEAGNYYEHGLLGTVGNLKVLHVQGRHNYPIELVKCLENNLGLEELQLEYHAQDSLFKCKIPNNLHLKILKMDSANFDDAAETKFGNFLTHSKRLQEIKLLKCRYEMFSAICNSLSVKRITFSPPYAHVSMPYLFQINPNDRITDLSLILVNEPLLREMLPKLPNLVKLYVSDPTASMFKTVITNCPSLKEFRYAYFRDVYYNEDLARSIYQKELLTGHSNVPSDLVITQI